MERRTILVTGSQGFVGRRLCGRLVESGFRVRATVRHRAQFDDTHELELFEVGDVRFFVGWSELLNRVDAIVHLIARTHVSDEFGRSALHKYRQLNVDVTQRLAKAAVREGVGHFIYVSSIKAVGNGADHDYFETTKCQPEDSYGISKLEAEQVLAETLCGSCCDYTILRPPLVYGEGVRGNFLRLLQLVQRGVPLPAVQNARSMVYVDNLVDATIRCLDLGASRNQLFHVADLNPISTTDLVRGMARGLGRAPRLVPLPQLFLKQFGSLVGKREDIKRLVGSLTVATDKIASELDWHPQIDTTDGVVRTSKAFLQHPWTDSGKLPARRAA